MKPFVESLKERVPADVVIDVLTTIPNRYQSFERTAPEFEETGNVTVRRFKLASHKSGFLDQANAFMRFYRQVRKYSKGAKYDLVFATSSRLMTAALGASIANRIGAPLYLDMRDIFTDTMNNVLKSPLKYLVLPVFNTIEKRTIRSAEIVNLVSRGFADYFSRLTEPARLRYFTNGIDHEFIDRSFESSQPGNGRKRILYAGNFGAGQGLHRIVPEAARAMTSDFEFHLVGDGGMKNDLIQSCHDLDNVVFRDPVDRPELMRMYAEADILFLHLNDYPAFRKVLPSKIFEYAATGKPMLAGVAGHAADFINENVDNAGVFEPCNARSMATALAALELSPISRPDFIRKFARDNIMNEMADDVLTLLPAADTLVAPAAKNP